MRKFYSIIIICVFLSAGCFADSPTLQIGWESAGRRVFPDSDFKSLKLKDVGEISAAGHEYEAVQLLVCSPKDIRNISVECSPLKNIESDALMAGENIELGLVETVIVKDETKAWPDPIFPYSPFDLKAGEIQSIWITVYVPAKTPAGEYESTVTIKGEDMTPLKTKLSVQVWGFDLPVIGTLKTITCWDFNPAYVDVMLKHRFNPGGQGSGDVARPRCILKKDGTIEFDWKDYDLKMQSLFDKGMSCFGLPWWAGDGTGNQYYRMIYDFEDEATGKNIRIELNPLKNERERELTRQWFAGFAKHLKEKGWFDRMVVYLWDEPGYKPIPTILKLSKFIKSVDPDYKILITEWPLDELYPGVDIFCTHAVNLCDPHLPVMHKAQKAGKELWWYACDNKFPAITYDIPYDALMLRDMGWMNWKFKLPGRVYFTFTWNRSQTPFVNPGNDGKGDGLLVYPMQNGKPVVSIRLAMHRDGVEDYEYLAILDRQIKSAKTRGVDSKLISRAKALLRVPTQIAKSADKYTSDPQVIEKQRTKIAKMIEMLNK